MMDRDKGLEEFWDLKDDSVTEDSIRDFLKPFDVEKLSLVIAQMEFKAFDAVKNEGGRADCQDNWNTFSIMRRSQYNCWTKEMQVQYAVDFIMSMRGGWNPVTEKYGRMEESTAPERWEAIKDSFPVIDEEARAIIEAIVRIQVGWMEEFAAHYPKLASGARVIHTYEDTPYDTSYETYLRGELSCYSPQMLSLYGAFVTAIARDGRNLASMIMEQTARLYGYQGLAEAEERL